MTDSSDGGHVPNIEKNKRDVNNNNINKLLKTGQRDMRLVTAAPCSCCVILPASDRVLFGRTCLCCATAFLAYFTVSSRQEREEGVLLSLSGELQVMITTKEIYDVCRTLEGCD